MLLSRQQKAARPALSKDDNRQALSARNGGGALLLPKRARLQHHATYPKVKRKRL